MANPQDSGLQAALEENRKKQRQTPKDFLSSLDDTPSPPPTPRAIPTFDAPQEAPGQKPISLGGFGENLLNNAWEITKGFVNLFPTALKGAKDVFGDPEGIKLLFDNPEHLVQAFRDTGYNLKEAIIDPYRKHGVAVIYHEPLTPVLDAMTILTLGGGAIAKGGRLAGSAKLLNAGERIAAIPERIGQSLLKLPMKAVGINPETRQLALRVRRQEFAGAKLEAGLRKERVLADTAKITNEEAATIERLVLDGGTKADLAAHPNAARVYGELDNWLKKEREIELGSKGRALLTDEQMQNRVIQEFAERRGVDFKTGAQLYKDLEVKPLYAPAIRESNGAFNFANAFIEPSVIKKGKAGFLERFKSAKGAAEIRTRLARAIDDFYSTRAALRFVDRLIQTPGMAKAVRAGEMSLSELIPSQGIFGKYFKDRARAESLFVKELVGTHGKEKAAQLLAGDLATQKARSQAINIAIPDPTLRKIIAREFRSVGGEVGAFLRVYDRLTGLFRAAATKLSPRWYTGNIVGDALLSSMAGSQWPLAKKLIQENALPRVLSSGPAGLAEMTADRIPLIGDTANRWVSSLAEGVGQVDDTARAGVFSKAVAKQLQSTMMRFSTSEEFLRAVKDIALAPDELADIMVKNQQLGEHAARGSRAIQGLDKEIASTKKLLNASLMEETTRQAKLLAPKVSGKAISIADKPGPVTGVPSLPAKALLASDSDVVKKAIDTLPSAISSESPIVKVQRSRIGEREAARFGDNVIIFDHNTNTLHIIDETNPEALFQARNELTAAWAWNNLSEADYAAWRASEGLPPWPPSYPGHRVVRDAAGEANVDRFARSVLQWVDSGKPPNPIMERIFAEPIPPAKLSGTQSRIELQRIKHGIELPNRRSIPSAELNNKLNLLLEKREQAVADLTKNMMAMEIEKIPELARKAEIAEQAIDRANMFLGEYLGLGPIERGVFRRIVPFYPWMKAMSKLAFMFPFVSPGKAFFWHRYATAMTEMMGDPELPDWLAAYTPVFVRQNGDTVWARFTALSPFGSLRTEKFGGVPIPSILAFWQSNPWISAAYRMAGGRDEWNAGSIPYGEPLVAINDGEVYKFNEQGKLERELTQAPLVRTTAHMFPVVQMIDQLIANYDVRKGRPVLNPDGTVKYPIELPTRIADAFGFKMINRNREQAIVSEKRRVQQAMEELRRKYPRADPEEKKVIEGIYEDYRRGEYRKIAAQ